MDVPTMSFEMRLLSESRARLGGAASPMILLSPTVLGSQACTQTCLGFYMSAELNSDPHIVQVLSSKSSLWPLVL